MHDVVDPVEEFGAQVNLEFAWVRIARQDDDRVAEVDRAALRVGDATVVEDLQEDRGDVGVRLLELVEEDHAIRAPSHRLRQLAGLVVAGVSGRRAKQSRDRVRLGVLREIDAHERILGSEELRGQRSREFRFADTAWTDEKKAADRFARILESRAAAADRLRDRSDCLVLAHDAFRKRTFEREQTARLLFAKRSLRDTRPLRNDRGDIGDVDDRAVAQRDRRRRLVDEIDRLIRQEPVDDVARGKRGRSIDRAIGDRDAVMIGVAAAQAAQDRARLFDRRFGDHHGLEAALERAIRFNVLAIFVERRRADALQFAARKLRLDHRGEIE